MLKNLHKVILLHIYIFLDVSSNLIVLFYMVLFIGLVEA